MRLIYADIVIKSIVAEKNAVDKINVFNGTVDEHEIGVHCGLSLAQAMVLNAPTIDAVEVVRCSDCKCWDSAIVRNGFLICLASGMEIMADDYCSYGERKETT